MMDTFFSNGWLTSSASNRRRRWDFLLAAICWPACLRNIRNCRSTQPLLFQRRSGWITAVDIEKGFSRVYQHYLLRLLKANAARKLTAWPGTLPVDLTALKSIRQLREFDELITAKAHGFDGAMDYYLRCSAMPLLPSITQPTLIIHAQDDPFMDSHVIPDVSQLPANIEYQLTEYGGHVGFVGGSALRPKMWLEARIPDWLTPYLDKQ